MPEHDVAVVIPAYRAETTVARAIGSVLRQPGVRVEVVVVVDASPDRTAERAKSSGDVAVLVNPTNLGAPASRNRGLEATTAPVVMFLDADDYVEGPLLCSLRDVLLKHEADVALGPSALEWPYGARKYQPLPAVRNGAALIADWLEGSYVPPCAVLWRRDPLDRVGAWDETLAKNQDGDLVFRAICSGARAACSGSGTGIYCQHLSGSRVSLQNSRVSLKSREQTLEYLLSQLATAGTVLADADPYDRSRLQQVIAVQYYVCARDAFDAELVGLGRQYLFQARCLGFHGYAGSSVHVCLARILGLRHTRGARRMLNRLKLPMLGSARH